MATATATATSPPDPPPPPTTPGPPAGRPAKPTGLSGAAAHDAVTLTWDAPEDASITGYQVLRGTDADTLAIIAGDTGAAGRRRVDQGLEPETEYTYAVKAINAAGTSEQSDPVAVTTLAAPELVLVQDADDEPPVSPQKAETCPGDGAAPTPVDVAVAAVPIVVASTTADYFVLYVRQDLDADTTVEQPVLVKLGEAGTTTLAENVAALPVERYRVEKYLIDDPADVDGDCVDDITELNSLGTMNPVNPGKTIELTDGAVAIPNRATFETLAAGTSVKFVLFDLDTARPGIYFQNTVKHPDHFKFVKLVGLQTGQRGMIRGEMTYDRTRVAHDGSEGAYRYWLTGISLFPDNSFSVLERSYNLLAASMPLLGDNLSFYIPRSDLGDFQSELPFLRTSRIRLLFDEDIYSGIGFLSLNPGEGYGRLQALEPDDRPHPRDVVIYEALPNELPRVAGIISTVPQTPLSHVNLRAVQDGIPNAYIRAAFIRDFLDNVDGLLGRYVYYKVTNSGWELRGATPEEVEAHYESSRHTGAQTPERDLSVTTITPLSDIGFEDWTAFGVKAANVAVLGTLGFPQGTVPDGFAIPFYFYDEFMKAHGFYDDVKEMLADPDFQTDFEVQDDMLDDLRDDIKDAETPQWIINALTAMHDTYPTGQSLRYRSSTNNEDLPGFNGAGLYDSKTQDPDETEEDGIDKSLKGVFASLWTFRAFSEREFHRIDHLTAAMGVLVHPNYSDELANGVAVSFNPLPIFKSFDKYEFYYVNTQLGEDLVTNPEAHSMPEEILIDQLKRIGPYYVISTSNLVERGELLMSNDQLDQLGQRLEVIHDHFKTLYNPGAGEQFAMEIEFKITGDDILAIKQARPWVFNNATNFVSEGAPTITGSPEVGGTLTASTSGITDSDGLNNVSYSYQWARVASGGGGSDIPGAISATYRVTAEDVGSQLKVKVAFTDDKGNPEALTSTNTAVVTVPKKPAGISLNRTSLTVSEGGNATYTVALASQPTATVTVTVTGHSGTDLSLNRSSLSFTTSNWNTPQTVTVNAAHDSGTSNDSASLTHRASGADYGTAASAVLTVTVRDDDTAPTPRPTTTSGGGTGGGGGGGGAALPTNRPPVFAEGADAVRSVPEYTRAGTAIGLRVAATDADRDSLTYTVGGVDGASFAIDRWSGQLRTRSALDFEGKPRHAVLVAVSDGKGGRAAISVAIVVTEMDLRDRYDADDNGTIDKDEATSAVVDYFDNLIGKDRIIEVVKLYFFS